MSSPHQAPQGLPGLPPNPYAPEDDVLIQQWEARSREAAESLLLLSRSGQTKINNRHTSDISRAHPVDNTPHAVPETSTTPVPHSSTPASFTQLNSSPSSVVDIQEYLKRFDPDHIERVQQEKRDLMRRVHEIGLKICKLPSKQRWQELVEFLNCIGLSRPEQDDALGVLKRLFQRNRETDNKPPPLVLSKWLCLLVHHMETAQNKAREHAKSFEPVKTMAPFCNGAVHKLECDHDSPSDAECGVNCYGYSAQHPDKPLTFDAGMSVVPCIFCNC